MYKRFKSYLSCNRLFVLLAFLVLLPLVFAVIANDTRVGVYTYDSWDEPAMCGECHAGFYTQWRQSMMS